MPVDTLLFILFAFAIVAFAIVSIILFILDAVKSKRERRRIKTGIKVMFILGIVFFCLLMAFLGFLMLLAVAVANHM